MTFQTEDGIIVPAITAEQMREVDRIAVEDFGLEILQMMENAGRNLAMHVRDMLDDMDAEVTVLAGSGGNGGGGLCCARHLHNRGFVVWVVLTKEPSELTRATLRQFNTVRAAGIQVVEEAQVGAVLGRSDIVVDALIGYSLRGTPRGRVAALIDLCNQCGLRVLSLDVPSGLDATTGEDRGLMVRADRTLTLALPKTGLRQAPGDLYLADIGIPPEVFHRLGLPSFKSPFAKGYSVRLEQCAGG